MKICILGSKEIKFQEQKLIEEAKNRFQKVTYTPIPEVRIIDGVPNYKGIKLSSFDCVFPRIPRTYSTFGYSILRLIENKTFIPIKPESVIISHNKFMTVMKLTKAGIKTPLSYLGYKRESFMNFLEDLKYPTMLKLVEGSLGKGVMFAESKSSTIPIMDTIESMNEPIMIENYIENPGEDIRIIVVDGNIIASMKRKSADGEKRANIGIGGTGEKIEPTNEMRSMAIKASKVLGLGVAGIDIIDGKDGPVIIEANVNVQFEGMTKTTNVNVAKVIIDYLADKAESKKNSIVTGLSRAIGDFRWKNS